MGCAWGGVWHEYGPACRHIVRLCILGPNTTDGSVLEMHAKRKNKRTSHARAKQNTLDPMSKPRGRPPKEVVRLEPELIAELRRLTDRRGERKKIGLALGMSRESGSRLVDRVLRGEGTAEDVRRLLGHYGIPLPTSLIPGLSRSLAEVLEYLKVIEATDRAAFDREVDKLRAASSAILDLNRAKSDAEEKARVALDALDGTDNNHEKH